MLITKNIQTSVDLISQDEIYHPNKKELVMKKLTERYVGKCSHSILIKEIKEITKLGDTEMSRTKLDGSAFIDVAFVVSGLVFNPGEILHKCKISEIYGIMITAKHDDAFVKIRSTGKFTKILNVGDVIPVLVQDSKYPINHTSITVGGTAYHPVAESAIQSYKITDGISVEQSAGLNQFLTEIAKEEKTHKDLKESKNHAAPYKYFQSLMYPYKTKQDLLKIPIIADQKSYNYSDFEEKSLLKISSGIIIYSDRDHFAERRLLHSNSGTQMDNTVSCGAYQAVVQILLKYYTNLLALRGFVETYGTKSEFEKLKNYWALCQTTKK